MSRAGGAAAWVRQRRSGQSRLRHGGGGRGGSTPVCSASSPARTAIRRAPDRFGPNSAGDRTMACRPGPHALDRSHPLGAALGCSAWFGRLVRLSLRPRVALPHDCGRCAVPRAGDAVHPVWSERRHDARELGVPPFESAPGGRTRRPVQRGPAQGHPFGFTRHRRLRVASAVGFCGSAACRGDVAAERNRARRHLWGGGGHRGRDGPALPQPPPPAAARTGDPCATGRRGAQPDRADRVLRRAHLQPGLGQAVTADGHARRAATLPGAAEPVLPAPVEGLRRAGIDRRDPGRPGRQDLARPAWETPPTTSCSFPTSTWRRFTR